MAKGKKRDNNSTGVNAKKFHLNERYDWTRDPKGLEYIYHKVRSLVTKHVLSSDMQARALVLDLGCGTGLITKALQPIGERVIATDINRWALMKCRERASVGVVQADVDYIPLRDESVDLAVATEVLEHLEDPCKALKEIFRVLRADGHFIGSAPTRSPIWKLRSKLSISCPAEEPFYHLYSKRTIESTLEECGFEIMELRLRIMRMNWFWRARKVENKL
jgi:ubiquinone/menaquinone biosynthesis C-methylase UbiE